MTSLQKHIEERGLSNSDVARLLKTNRQAVGRWTRNKPRLPLKWAKMLSAAWGVSALELMYTADELADLSEDAKMRILSGDVPRVLVEPMITGVVAGGKWLDVSSGSYDPIPYPNPVSVPGDIDGSAVFILQIDGPSVNQKAQDGGYVVCLPLNAAPRNFRAGDWVVAERQRGDLVETTVKQVGRDEDGRWELRPASDDPRHQSPIVVGEHDDDVVRIVAFAIDFINPGTKF